MGAEVISGGGGDPTWVLGTEVGSSERATSANNLGAISPAQQYQFVYLTKEVKKRQTLFPPSLFPSLSPCLSSQELCSIASIMVTTDLPQCLGTDHSFRGNL